MKTYFTTVATNHSQEPSEVITAKHKYLNQDHTSGEPHPRRVVISCCSKWPHVHTGPEMGGENYPLLILLNSDRTSGDRVLKLSGLLLEKRQYFHHLEAK